MTKENPEIVSLEEMTIIKISDIGENFRKWLYGQTVPYIEELDDPDDWAYYWDYLRWKNNQPIID